MFEAERFLTAFERETTAYRQEVTLTLMTITLTPTLKLSQTLILNPGPNTSGGAGEEGPIGAQKTPNRPQARLKVRVGPELGLESRLGLGLRLRL